jgi:alkylation response protein AidB-like acyl-CoA dehydrogenase
MDFELSSEHRLLKDTAKAFADGEIMPGARDRDREGVFPDDIITKLGALGFLGPLVPEKYGGMGADFLS